MTVRGFYAVGVYHPKNSINIGTLWRSASILGAAFIYTVGARYKRQSSDTMGVPKHIPLFHFDDIEDLKKHLPDSCPLIAVELDDRAINIKDFIHPARACYMLGAEDSGIPTAVLDRCHKVIKLDGESSMNVAVAGSIVIYHRRLLTKGILNG